MPSPENRDQKGEQASLTLTVLETAALLRISKSVCYEAIRTGQIKSLRFGRRIVVPKASLMRLLACEETSIHDKSSEI